MAVVEQEPQPSQESVQRIPEQFGEEVAERLAEQGISVTQTQPKKVIDDQGKVVAQPTTTSDDDGDNNSVVIPFGEGRAINLSKGKAEDSGTWLGVFVSRMIAVARHAHKKIFIRS